MPSKSACLHSVRAAVLAGAVVVGGGCASGPLDGDRGLRGTASAPFPTGEVTPFGGSPQDLVAEFRTLIRELRPAAPGRRDDLARLERACARVDTLRDTFQKDIPSRQRAGLSDGEFILLYGAANDCADRADRTRATIEHILEHRANREKGAPTPSPFATGLTGPRG